MHVRWTTRIIMRMSTHSCTCKCESASCRVRFNGVLALHGLEEGASEPEEWGVPRWICREECRPGGHVCGRPERSRGGGKRELEPWWLRAGDAWHSLPPQPWTPQQMVSDIVGRDVREISWVGHNWVSQYFSSEASGVWSDCVNRSCGNWTDRCGV